MTQESFPIHTKEVSSLTCGEALGSKTHARQEAGRTEVMSHKGWHGNVENSCDALLTSRCLETFLWRTLIVFMLVEFQQPAQMLLERVGEIWSIAKAEFIAFVLASIHFGPRVL